MSLSRAVAYKTLICIYIHVGFCHIPDEMLLPAPMVVHRNVNDSVIIRWFLYFTFEQGAYSVAAEATP